MARRKTLQTFVWFLPKNSASGLIFPSWWNECKPERGRCHSVGTLWSWRSVVITEGRTLSNKKIKLSSYIRKFICNQSHIWLNIWAFPHLLGAPSSYMALQPIPSEFPYIWWKFCFLFYQCTVYLCTVFVQCLQPMPIFALSFM